MIRPEIDPEAAVDSLAGPLLARVFAGVDTVSVTQEGAGPVGAGTRLTARTSRRSWRVGRPPDPPPHTLDRIDPLIELRDWIEEARAAGLAQPASVAFVTVGADGAPSARTVNLKRIEPDGLVFTSALWTRKARELSANPRVSLLFHWQSLGRQVHVAGEASWAERALAEELFGQRDLHHQLQTVVSRQGEPIDDLDPLRDRLEHLASVQETPPPCPDDWGALRVLPAAIEFWAEAPDRIHERRLFERDGDGDWRLTLLSP